MEPPQKNVVTPFGRPKAHPSGPSGSRRGKETEASYAKFAGVLERGGISTRVGAGAATLASVRVPPGAPGGGSLCPPQCTGEHRGNVALGTGEKFPACTGKVPASVDY